MTELTLKNLVCFESAGLLAADVAAQIVASLLHRYPRWLEVKLITTMPIPPPAYFRRL